MPAGNISTFDGNPNATPAVTVGYRPGANDFNGAALVDDPVNPPDPATMPTSALLNTTELTLVSVGKVVPTAFVCINASSTPTVAFWGAAPNLITVNPFTIVRNGAGDYSITTAAGALPVPTAWPRAHLNIVGGVGAHNCTPNAVPITNGVRVTTSKDGALADLNFTAEFF